MQRLVARAAAGDQRHLARLGCPPAHELTLRPEDQDVGMGSGKAIEAFGKEGIGGSNAMLANPPGKNDRTMVLYVPNATTVFDFIRRAMPWPQPKSLSNDEVYALTAYVLARNKVIGENDTMNAETLPKVAMPNRNGFVSRYPDKH